MRIKKSIEDKGRDIRGGDKVEQSSHRLLVRERLSLEGSKRALLDDVFDRGAVVRLSEDGCTRTVALFDHGGQESLVRERLSLEGSKRALLDDVFDRGAVVRLSEDGCTRTVALFDHGGQESVVRECSPVTVHNEGLDEGAHDGVQSVVPRFVVADALGRVDDRGDDRILKV